MTRDPLHNRIVREVIARVAAGAWPPGRRLPGERALCADFAVARGTLRKALRQLKTMGVLRIAPSSGIHVQGLPRRKLPVRILPPDLANVRLRDVITARKAIELPASRAAARNATAAQLAALRKVLSAMSDSLDDLPRFIELDMAFHRAVIDASANPVLASAFDAIRDYHRFSSVYTSQREGDERTALDFHRRWLNALEDRDPDAVAAVLDEHLDSVLTRRTRS